MKAHLTLIIILFFITSCTVTATTKQSKLDIQNKLALLVEQNNLVGSHFVAVVDENGLVLFSSINDNSITITPNTQFMLASHTKAMTSSLLALLDAKGAVDLNLPLSQYKMQPITNEKVQVDTLTLSHLLTHTGGFVSVPHLYKTAFLGYDSEAEIKNILNKTMRFAPDHSFRYANTGPIVAAMIAEQQTQQAWQQLLNDHLFTPLKMKNTTTKVSEANNLLPAITTAADGSLFYYDHHKTDKTMHASGGVISNVNDMALWLKANINQDFQSISNKNIFKLLHQKQVEQDKQYFTYHRHGYTLGWDSATYNGEKLLTRFGTYGGYSVHVSFMPKAKLGVIAFSNQDIAFILPHVMANYAYNSLLNKNNTMELFNDESEQLQTSVKKGLDAAPNKASIVLANEFEKRFIGHYQANDIWPKMQFYIHDKQVKVKWGELVGTLLKEKEDYQAHFGSLTRTIKVNVLETGQLSLKNGSIVYKKL